MKMVTSYKAFDGTFFTNGDQCIEYERDALIRIAETVKSICNKREECFDLNSRCPFFIFDSDNISIDGRCMFASCEDKCTPDQFDF